MDCYLRSPGEHSPSPRTSIIEIHRAGERKAACWSMASFWLLPYIHVVTIIFTASSLKLKISAQFVDFALKSLSVDISQYIYL